MPCPPHRRPAWPLPLLGLLALAACHAGAAAKAAKEARFERELAAERHAALTLSDAGTAPRRRLVRALEPGTVLRARVDTVNHIGMGHDHPEMKRTYRSHAVLRVSVPKAAPSKPTFTVTALEGNLPDLDALPKTGTLELGDYGEPWIVTLSPTPRSTREGIWEMDLKHWLRDLLPPLPTRPVGVGARWTVRWHDYFGFTKILDTRTYRLVALHGDTARIRTRRVLSGEDSANGSTSRSVSTGELVLPLGATTVPRAQWSQKGHAVLLGPGRPARQWATSTSTLRPAAAPAGKGGP